MLIPSATNYDWTRVYNVPAAADGTASTLTTQGTYSVYERTSNNFYQYINTFIMPDAETNRHLGFKMEITKHVDGSYSAYVLSKGNGTFTQPGRVNILSWQDASTGWKLGVDENYRGEFDSNVAYRLNDYVKVGDKVYPTKTNLTAGQFVPINWTEITEGLDLNGFVPNNTGFILGVDSAIETTDLFEFGTQFDVSSNGEVLATIVRYGDSN